MPKTSVFSFSDLSPEMLYEILKLRQDVFIIEQTCPYEDMDNLDQNALHLLMINENTLAAYCRILSEHPDLSAPAIGRIVVHPSQRGQGFGKIITADALELLKSHGHVSAVIEAQEHLEHFYNSIGFFKTSDPYDLDGIIHIHMEINLT